MSSIMVPPPNEKQHSPMAVSEHGMVASAQPLAAIEGLKVLMEGGNAFDAAITVALVEDVTLSPMTSLGGDLFAVLYDQSSDHVFGVNGSGSAPHKANVNWFKENHNNTLPDKGILSSSVPGEVHALMTIHQRFGSLPIERLMKPAIQYAENGFPVNERLKWRIQRIQNEIRLYPTTSKIFLPNGKVPEVGSILYQKDLAKTLKTLMNHGLKSFYQGEVAEKITDYVNLNGGLIDEADMRNHQTEIYRPISTTYRDFTIFETSPPSQGLIVLESLNILEGFDLSNIPIGSAELIHLMAETKKIAYSDRLKYCGDPRFVRFDIDRLISKEFAAKQRHLIDRNYAMNHYNGFIEKVEGDTTYLTVVDRDGNCVSLIHSLSGVEFGSCEVAGETGVVMNSRLGRGFTLDPMQPNVLEPNKRTMHTLNAYMAFKDGKPCFIGGSPGGDQQPQWNFQVLVNLIDYNLNVQMAAEYPRWFSFPGADRQNLNNPFELRMEKRFDPGTYRQLEKKGHQIKLLPAYSGGGVQLIQLDHHHGVLKGGSDPRIGGVALGY